MKVSELIDKLRAMPQDVEVVVRSARCSGSFDGSCAINVYYAPPEPVEQAVYLPREYTEKGVRILL